MSTEQLYPEGKFEPSEVVILRDELKRTGDSKDAIEIVTSFFLDRGYAVDKDTVRNLTSSIGKMELEEFRLRLEEAALEN